MASGWSVLEPVILTDHSSFSAGGTQEGVRFGKLGRPSSRFLGRSHSGHLPDTPQSCAIWLGVTSFTTEIDQDGLPASTTLEDCVDMSTPIRVWRVWPPTVPPKVLPFGTFMSAVDRPAQTSNSRKKEIRPSTQILSGAGYQWTPCFVHQPWPGVANSMA